MIIVIIIIEKSRSATVTTHSQPPIPRGREKWQKSIRVIVFFCVCVCVGVAGCLFKNVKSFYTGKIAKKKKMLFVYGMYARLFLFMACAEPVYSSFRTPTLPHRAQPLLYATGKMSLNWGLDCSSICSMHAPAEFWTRNRMNNEIWIKKINTGNHEFFLENLILVFGVMTSHFTSSVQLGLLLIS